MEKYKSYVDHVTFFIMYVLSKTKRGIMQGLSEESSDREFENGMCLIRTYASIFLLLLWWDKMWVAKTFYQIFPMHIWAEFNCIT